MEHYQHDVAPCVLWQLHEFVCNERVPALWFDQLHTQAVETRLRGHCLTLHWRSADSFSRQHLCFFRFLRALHAKCVCVARSWQGALGLCNLRCWERLLF
ncbi:hypothetical protein TRVL_08869 [Trypanosoma vivax]|nr:hypothetical protein TRVL_08869 [Trypanosoma vivax]